MTSIKTFYECRSCDERSSTVFSVVDDKQLADELVKGKGAWGSDGYVREICCVEINGEYYQLSSEIPIQVTHSASYSKLLNIKQSLSPQELRILKDLI